MTFKHIVKFTFFLFCVITTMQIIFVPILDLINGRNDVIYIRDLYRYPLIAFASVLPTFILVNSDQMSRNGWRIRVILHCILTQAAVFGGLVYFNRVTNLSILVQIGLFFTAIYAGAWWGFNRKQQSLANQINERINHLHRDEESSIRKDSYNE